MKIMKNVKIYLMVLLLAVMSTNAWSAVESGTAYRFNKNYTPAGWTYSHRVSESKADYMVICKPDYICSEAFFQQSITSIVINMRRYGGSDAQATVTLTWVDSSTGTETALGTLAPANGTTLADATKSSFTNTPTANTTGYIKITCPGANSTDKGAGIASIKINYTVCSKKFAVHINSITNGSASSDKSTACPGEIVTITLSPDANYGLDVANSYAQYWDENGDYQQKYFSNSFFTKVNSNTYTFIMPDIEEDGWLEEIAFYIYMTTLPDRSVTWHVPSGCITTPADGTYTTAKVFPNPTPLVSGYKFEGWVASAIPSTQSSRPATVYAAGEPIPSDGTYYALYSSISTTFTKVTDAIPIDGKNYLLCNAYSATARAWKNEVDANKRLTSKEWDCSSATTTCYDWDCIWTFIRGTGSYSDYWFIYNAQVGKYLGANSTTTSQTTSPVNYEVKLIDGMSDASAWQFSQSSGRLTLTNKLRTANGTAAQQKIYCSGNYAGFGYSSSTSPYFFEQGEVSTSYTTSPDGCAATYTVTYEGGSGATGSVTDTNSPYDPGYTPITVKSNGFTKTGYNFTGWVANVDIVNASTSATITQGTLIAPSTTFTMPSSNVVFTAQWEAKTYLYGSSCEPLENITVTYNDGGDTWEREYGVGAQVTVDVETGTKGCANWRFVGWQRGSAVANNSTTYTPVHNFTATAGDDEALFYAVYDSVGTDWISAFDASELKSGAEYVIVKQQGGENDDYALTTTVASTNYLAGSQLATDVETVKDASNNNRYKLGSSEVVSDAMKWEASYVNSAWRLYNKASGKYIKLNSSNSNVSLTETCDDSFTITPTTHGIYDNDSELKLQSTSTKYLGWYNSGPYWHGNASSRVVYMITNAQKFTFTPPCSPRSVTFHGNGGTVSDGVNSGVNLVVTEASRDAGITTPTATFADCNGKSWSFAGWINRAVDVTRVPVLTTEMIDDGGGNKHHDISADNEEYWAVYTNQGTPETKYGKITFTEADFIGEYTTGTKTKTAGGNDFDFSYARMGKAAEIGIQFEAGTGVIQNTTSLGKVNYISFRGVWSGDENLSKLKIYVGETADAITTEVTSAAFQATGDSLTYYPSANYPYVKIMSASQYVAVESITIGFGLGTKVWATTPDCSIITLEGDIKVTSVNGQGIQAVTPVTVNASQLGAGANVVLRSDNQDIYFSTDRTPNFAMAAANQPKTTATVTAGSGEGNITDEMVYIHYKPSSAGDGVGTTAKILATCPTNPEASAELTINVRNMPEKFVIATKVGAAWYALPADMGSPSNPAGVLIDVNETNMTATAPKTCSYGLWPVKTTNGTYDRYGTNATFGGNAYGERVRFASSAENGNKALWANNNASLNTLSNSGLTLDSRDDGGNEASANASYEWKIVTTITDGKWSYTLQSDQTQNDRYLRYWSAASGGPKWGTYANGEQNLYFLPVTEVEPFEMQVVEWYPTKVLVQTEAALASPTVKVNSESVASPVLTNKGGKLWEISGLPLENNPTKSMTVAFSADEKNYACTKMVPIIISREDKTQASEPFATLGSAIYTKSDVVVRDGAVLTVNGTIEANTFNDVSIYPTSKISVPSEKKLTVHALTFFGGIDEIYNGSTYAVNKYGVPELSLKGQFGTKTITKIDYVMRVDLDQMYQTGVPYDVDLNAITYWDGTAMTPGTNLYVSAYDGQARANKESKTWIWEEDFESKLGAATLKAGIGYTISAELQSGVGDTYSIIRMPMASNVAANATEGEKSVNVVAYDNTKDETITANNKGWNYLSNPYMVSISGGEADSKLVVGYLEETGSGSWGWKDDTYRYVTIPHDDGTDYYQMKFSEATLKPFKSFFLQIGTSGVLTFALASRQNAPARYLETSAREVEFEVLLSNASRTDNTGLLIAEKYSPAYEINADLEKMIGSMSVYTIYGGYNLAYNALSPTDAEQLIPVGYVAPSAGEYTFGLDEQGDYEQIEHIYLTDYEQGLTTDLLNENYTFTTATGKNESRFAINVILKEEGSELPTGVDVIGGDKDDGIPLKFIWEDKMYILRNGIIYDATGKKVGEIK